jgi:hypothetical protein
MKCVNPKLVKHFRGNNIPFKILLEFDILPCHMARSDNFVPDTSRSPSSLKKFFFFCLNKFYVSVGNSVTFIKP